MQGGSASVDSQCLPRLKAMQAVGDGMRKDPQQSCIGCLGARLLLASASQDRYVRIWAIRPVTADTAAAGQEAPAEDMSSLISRYTASTPSKMTGKLRSHSICLCTVHMLGNAVNFSCE